MIDVIEIEPANSQRLEVIDRGGFRDFFPQRRVVRREHPGNERGESASIFLNAAQALQVIEPQRSRYATKDSGLLYHLPDASISSKALVKSPMDRSSIRSHYGVKHLHKLSTDAVWFASQNLTWPLY